MDLAKVLAEKLVHDYPNEISMQQHAGTQAFLTGDYSNAEFIWDACNRRREQLLTENELDKLGHRILGPSWVIAIGHIAHLDIYLKWCKITGRNHKAVLTIPVGFKIPNTELLDRWRPFLTPTLPEDIHLTLPEVEILQDEFWSLSTAEGRWRMFSHAGAWVQAEWEKRGGAPLLTLSQEDQARGMEGLQRLGIPDGAWYVCLHVREPGFHQAWHKHHPGTRNADIRTYTDAMRAVTERGGYVIRMGDNSMRRLPFMDKVIDYAHSDCKSEFMDLFLCASCRFFIGTNSGLGLVPPVYGVPCALTNWSPIALPQWYPNDLFIPKLCHSERLGRLLTFKEMFRSKAGWGQFSDYFARERITILDNGPDELSDLVVEMLDRESGVLRETQEDAALYDTYLRHALEAGSYAGARIGRRFLSKHRELLAGLEDTSLTAHGSTTRYAAG